MTLRVRIDRLLVDRGMFSSRAKAQDAIAAGWVKVGGVPVTAASEQVATNAAVSVEPHRSWVSRGGIKLSAALAHFKLDPRGHVCLDVGASTGGFTEVLLSKGARRVYAVDVGRDQMHPKVRRRPEVVSIEGADIRRLRKDRLLPELPDFVCIDVGFISLTLVLPAAFALVRFPARLLALIKPQFEAGPGATNKGIVRDTNIQEQACGKIAAFLQSHGWKVTGIMPSPIAGHEGNREFFIAASHG
jgi:23S rRNA (cytidine1920-2'-O)/16S rRNA (cytidine1409-2'-O)-methyltransferase